MGGERYRRGSYFAKATQDRRRAPAFRLFRSHSLAPVPNHPARRHGIRSRYSEPKGRASRNGRIFNRRLRRFAQIRKGYHARLKSIRYSEPQGRASRPRHAATRCDRRAAHRLCTATPAHSATYPPLRELPRSGADIPVCARPRGQTGMSAPHFVPTLCQKSCISPRTRRSGPTRMPWAGRRWWCLRPGAGCQPSRRTFTVLPSGMRILAGSKPFHASSSTCRW